MLRFLTAGESHGEALVAILDGMVAHLKISEDDITKDLRRRQEGKGRGDRMKIENDKAQILSGIAKGETLGSPIALLIPNKAKEAWEKPFTQLRPGHADLAGAIKYNQKDLRPILERASARETAARVVIGTICKKFLSEFKIKISSSIIHIGGKSSEKEIENAIENVKKNGDSLGGVFEVKCEKVPIGLGSCMQWDKRLDGLLAQAMMSIHAIKGVEIGLGFESAKLQGSKVHDEIFYKNNKFSRGSNNAGGLEGGMTNGEPIVLKCAMKPISTLTNPLQSVDLITKNKEKAHVERADVCAVEAAAVVAEAMAAFILAGAFIEKFGGDSLEETFNNFSSFQKSSSML
ncbi:chorismate synthase [candidate division WOR-1 bacterium RIFOXYD2_FULL_36_8]|uniref:Chorismate synthase n=1 Tax=candidate division WOR-1 bacterium RIFOXYB2_FULL_36_35 TaxID=1802578 RepID=A0A1F4S0S2_UNCSA|nr:MAG: chorismate synthase [candidate division WOR-1 bacterium RIFOXYA2_FULL_36_21]OGC13987.1 MAG: chorismate synthase [candidate division WOR-1 bacterium RIFOXYB2_FULL_36_35]OGC18803.1 MAG: chorismate synthase [candidate division WOR-1 bacterium RIFOXYA12_FULL_36_13]OGC41219.1 MAG: chorismate synthase [candidate division WOR-1 bacterium RIFOXYD2_FULL_36_8]